MENQAKVIVIERNKFASLVKSHRKCLQMLNILTHQRLLEKQGNSFVIDYREPSRRLVQIFFYIYH